jgi:hypothetical protein
VTDVVAPPDAAPVTEAPRAPSRAARVGVLCVFLTAIIGIGTPLVGDRVFLGADLLQVYSPWRTHTSVTAEKHLLFSDTIDFYTPQRILAAKALRAGELPWWNPYPAGGTPLASIPDTAVFSPLNLPWLILPGWLAPAYSALVGLAVAALGMYLFLRRLLLSKPAAVIGGAAYMTTGFMTSWTGWPHQHVAALVPALFWAIERALQRATWRASIPIAVVLAIMWAEGFPAVTGFAIYAAAVYTLFRLAATLPWAELRGAARDKTREMLRPLLRARARLGGIAAAGIALGSGLIAFQLLPFIKHLSVVDTTSRDQLPRLHLALPTIATIVFPYAFGSPVAGSSGHGNYFGPNNNLIEINAYVGAAMVVCVIALIAWRRPRRVPSGACAALFTIVVVTLIAVYHGGALLAVLQKFPVFSNNPIRRATSIIDFALPALGAIGIERVLSYRDELRLVDRRRVAVVWVLGAIGFVVLLAKVISLAGPSGNRGWVATHALVGVASAVVTAAALWYAARSARHVRVLCVVLPIVVMVEGLAFVVPWWPTSNHSDFYPQTATHTYLQQHLGEQRYAAEGGTMLQSSNTYYELRAVTAHAFRQPTWYQLVAAIEPSVVQPATQLFLGQDMKSLPSPVLDRLSAQYFVADPVRPIPGSSVNPPAATSSVTLSRSTPVSGALPASSAPLRGVIVDLARPLPSSGASEQRLTVDVLAGNRQVARGFRDLNDGWSAGGLAIAVPETRDTATSVRLTYTSTKNPLVLASDGHSAAAGRIDDPGDGARVVQSGDAVVYDRTHALPRIRWMPKSTVIASQPARLKALVDGTVPLDTVVLSSAKGVPAGSGQPARSFKVVTDGPDHIRVDVDAGGAGFVEVADAIQHGWTATVDGHSATLLDADHALVAVAVPAGHHVIDVTYHATGQRKGFAVSFLSLLVLLGIGTGPFLRRRIKMQRAAAIPSGSGTE